VAFLELTGDSRGVTQKIQRVKITQSFNVIPPKVVDGFMQAGAGILL